MEAVRIFAAMGRNGVLLTLFLLALTAEAGETAPMIDAAQIVSRAAPAVLALTVHDEQGKEIGVRSAIVLGAGKAVSTCSGSVAGDKLTLAAGGRSWMATFSAYDDEHNLCQLAAHGRDIAPELGCSRFPMRWVTASALPKAHWSPCVRRAPANTCSSPRRSLRVRRVGRWLTPMGTCSG